MMKFLNVNSISIAFMCIYKKSRKTTTKMFSYIISVHTDWLNYIEDLIEGDLVKGDS